MTVEEKRDTQNPQPPESCCSACGLWTVSLFPGTPAVTGGRVPTRCDLGRGWGGSPCLPRVLGVQMGKCQLPGSAAATALRGSVQPALRYLSTAGVCGPTKGRAGAWGDGRWGPGRRGGGAEGSLSTFYTSNGFLGRNSWASRRGSHSQLAFPPLTGAHTWRVALHPARPIPAPSPPRGSLPDPRRSRQAGLGGALTVHPPHHVSLALWFYLSSKPSRGGRKQTEPAIWCRSCPK